jgi:hypothetical protein
MLFLPTTMETNNNKPDSLSTISHNGEDDEHLDLPPVQERNNNKANDNHHQEEDDRIVDDRTWLDVFGEMAKDYLTHQIIPPTDADCVWD